jgi:alpha-galactosidase
LADLKAVSLGKPHSTLGLPKLNRSIRNEPLKVGGKQFTRGIGVHAPSELTYAVQPEWARFVAVVGLDDERPTGSVVFQVYADKRKIADTPVMTQGVPWHVNVEIPADTKQVRLVVTDAGDGTGADHGDWIDAGFLRK